ncbi:D-alanyl-D-alanine carboxypeptidase family protein [Actinomycetota bacterium Odt1-20B]
MSAVKKTKKTQRAQRTALLVASAALLTVSTAAPALADGKPGGDKDKPQPPKSMSTVGGAQLGKPGTQVRLKSGAPVLPKDLSGRSWIVSDAETGDVLASHNAHWRLAPASTLKMLFADTVLPKFPKNLKHKTKLSDFDGIGAGSSMVGVKENETYTVHDLWLGVFLRSGNDAVHVLSAMNGGVKETVKDMQAHAESLQALDTHVVTPDGYDEKGQVSSAYDLTLFARSGLQKKDFREYCSTATAKFPGATKKDKKTGKTKRESFGIQNTNRLLTGLDGVSRYKGIAGVKNGSTTNAGTTFTGVAERGGKVLLVTVMNPSSGEPHAVYKETARLLDWGFAASGKVDPVGELVPPKGARTGAGKGAPGAGKDGSDSAKTVASSSDDNSGGMGVALGITGGVLVLLAGGVFLINRRWPLPELVRRRSGRRG